MISRGAGAAPCLSVTVTMSMDSEEVNNDFNSWDCLGAGLMLGITPAILNFVCNDKEIVSTVIFAGIGVIIAVVVWLVALITRSRLVGVVVNWAGSVLTVLYIAIALFVCFSATSQKEETSTTESAESGAEPAAANDTAS